MVKLRFKISQQNLRLSKLRLGQCTSVVHCLTGTLLPLKNIFRDHPIVLVVVKRLTKQFPRNQIISTTRSRMNSTEATLPSRCNQLQDSKKYRPIIVIALSREPVSRSVSFVFSMNSQELHCWYSDTNFHLDLKIRNSSQNLCLRRYQFVIG